MAVEISLFQDLKLAIDSVVPLGRPAQHVLAGTVLFSLALPFSRVRRSTRLWLSLLLTILVIAAAAEAIDLYDDARSLGYRQWRDSGQDILLTMVFPTIATLFRFCWRRGPG